MRARADRLVIGLFAAFMLGPLASLAALGYDAFAERRETLRPFQAAAFVAHSDTYRGALLREAITGSELGAATIKWRAEVDSELFGIGSNSSVMEGLDGWLFVEDQFDGGRCRSEGRTKLGLLPVAAMGIAAEAADLEFVFSVSPDKSLVHPEHLTWRMEALAECKRANARLWREVAGRAGIDLVDHLNALAPPGVAPRFYATDTHWNGYGGRLAVEQLRARFQPPRAWSPEVFATPPLVRDLTVLLRSDAAEVGIEVANPPPLGPPVPGHTVVAHDSFYGSIIGLLPELFASLHAHYYFADGEEPEDLIAALAPGTDRLVVNTVERLLFRRMERGERPFSWSGLIGRAILARNEAVARGCAFAPGGAVRVSAPGEPVVLPDVADSARPCLRLSGDIGGVSVALPLDVDGWDEFERGHAIELPDAPDATDASTAIVLPSRFGGRAVRIESRSGVAVETGALPPSGAI